VDHRITNQVGSSVRGIDRVEPLAGRTGRAQAIERPVGAERQATLVELPSKVYAMRAYHIGEAAGQFQREEI
jgi:hypothetical protein